MSNPPDSQKDAPEETGTTTQHGHWTPEDSEAAAREVRELAQNPPEMPPAKDSVDKSHLDLPKEQRPIDH